ncbi:hypothetical protein ACLI4Q_19970 [Natrialbaceae archaeon A-CW1-1]
MKDETAIPEAMRARDQWLCWRSEKRNGKSTKIPIDPQTGAFGSSTDDSTWRDFESALEYFHAGGCDGIGFVFTEDDPYVGIDLDDCRDPETRRPDPEMKSIVQQLDSYTEVSPSGTGYHVIVDGELPPGRNRRGKIELYDRARYFTVTGEHVSGLPTEIESRQPELEMVHREHVDQNSRGRETSRGDVSGSSKLSNQEVLEKARAASNGEKFDRLWSGSTVGYDSHSEADMALCCLLAFWTGGDHHQMDRLFRHSGLVRAKWDEIHYSDGSTYGERTLERAIEHTSEFYEPQIRDEKTESLKADQRAGGGSSTTRHQQYLEKKNDILEKRVEALEATLEEKNQLIGELERDVERNDRMQVANSNSDERRGRQSDAGRSLSLWQKLCRRVRSQTE